MDTFSFSGSANEHLLALPNAVHDTTEPARLAWSTQISLQAFVQRLSLLVDLELPCTICLGLTGEDQCCRGVIRECSWNDGQLRLRGDDFNLKLDEDRIDSLRLVNRRRPNESETAVEVLGTGGVVIARIRGTPDREPAAIWQDIMDSFAVATV